VSWRWDWLADHWLDLLAGHRRLPNLAWHAWPREARHPFLILGGEETVGVVVRRVGGDVAHVELDDPTPRSRGSSPGGLVWRRSVLPRRLGTHTVVTSPAKGASCASAA
jgi:hypothetical protein